MPEDVDPQNLRVTDDLYAAGRAAFALGLSVLENPMPATQDYGRAWFAGWLDALADSVTGDDRSARAYARLLPHDKASPF